MASQEESDDVEIGNGGAPLWRYVTKNEKDASKGGTWNFECNICKEVKKGSYSRVRAHLLGIANVDRRAEAIVADVETAASQVTNEAEATPSSQRINKAYLERVKPNRGRIYGLGSKQFEVFEPSEPVAASLSRTVDMDMRVDLSSQTCMPF